MRGGNAAEAGPRSRVACENLKAEWHRRMLRSTDAVAFSTALPLGPVLFLSTFLLQGLEYTQCRSMMASDGHGPWDHSLTYGWMAPCRADRQMRELMTLTT